MPPAAAPTHPFLLTVPAALLAGALIACGGDWLKAWLTGARPGRADLAVSPAHASPPRPEDLP